MSSPLDRMAARLQGDDTERTLRLLFKLVLGAYAWLFFSTALNWIDIDVHVNGTLPNWDHVLEHINNATGGVVALSGLVLAVVHFRASLRGKE